MNDHHLVLGQTVDFLTGRIIDDTLDERLRQGIARLLVLEKGYAKSDIQAGRAADVAVENKRASVPVTFVVTVGGREAMLIQYGPGSLVTRHRPALALARLAAPFQIPVVVVTNGVTADVLHGDTGRIQAAGLNRIPSKAELIYMLRDYSWSPVPEKRRDLEARILMAYEVDDRCPCDSSICTRETGEDQAGK